MDEADIWASLDAEASRSAKVARGSLVKQRVHIDSKVPVFFAVDPRGHTRSLLIEVPSDRDFSPATLPRWKGMKAELWGGQGEVPRQRVLSMRHLVPAHAAVFEAVVSDVSRRVAEGTDAAHALELLIGALQRWKSFFALHGFDGLSREMQQGLYAELFVLRKFVIPEAGTSPAVYAWTGGEGATHDFQFPGGAIEVKSTRASKPDRIRIASEKQLDDAGLSMLVLAAVRLYARLEGGETLPGIVEDVRRCLSADDGARANFEDRLLKYGYMDTHAPEYRNTYHVDAVKAYGVREGFPRLLAAGLPEGVGDISYSVVLSACSEFELDPQEAIGRMVSEGIDVS